jgi:hypothetical protein
MSRRQSWEGEHSGECHGMGCCGCLPAVVVENSDGDVEDIHGYCDVDGQTTSL